MIMRTTFLISSCVLALALNARAQTPTPPPDATAAPTLSATPDTFATPPVAAISTTPLATATVAPSATMAPTTAPTASPSTEDEFDSAIEKRIAKHFNIDLDGDSSHDFAHDDPWWIAVIVLIGCVTFFGTPVAIVAAIMYFSFSKSRAMHKTVRMMVEKGQPVPEALLNPPTVIRQRSDLRRGVVLLMVGTGLMVFFGACNDWEGGAWSLGIIPFLIGLGYLLVWRLDVHRDDASPKV